MYIIPVKRGILIVEDDEDIRDALRMMLEDETDCSIYTACNGREALDVLGRIERPCLILLDLMMPIMSGWDVLKALQADATLSTVPVAVVSAVHGKSPEGAARFLPKPVDTDDLLAVVHEFC